MVARRMLTVFTATLAWFAAGSVLAQPPISEEIDLDHGYRYTYNPEVPQRSDIAVGDGTVLMMYMDQGTGQAFALLHDPSGPRQGSNFLEVFDYDDHAETFSCSDVDPMGWKIAYVGGVGQFGGSDVMRVRNLHPDALEQEGLDLELAAGSGEIGTPLIARYPGGHVVVWIEGTALWLRRCTVNLDLLDDAPRQIATGVKGAALAWRSPGGMVAWSDLDGGLYSRRLDENALPVGGTNACGSTPEWAPFDLAPLGERWILAWNAQEGIRFNILDAGGTLASARVEPMALHDGPVAVCSSDSTAMILAGNVVCLRVDVEGNPIGAPTPIADLEWTYAEQDWMMLDPRAYACAWTGTSFTMLFHEFVQMITSPTTRGRAGGAGLYPGGIYEVPVFAQWMAEDGSLLLPEPLHASRGSVVWATCPWTRGDRTLAVLRDGASDPWLHTMQLDRQGNVLAPAKRFRTPADEVHCGIWECDWSGIGTPIVRPWGEDAACLYTYNDGHSSEWYTSGSEALLVDRLSAEGDSLGRTGIPVGRGESFPYLANVDFASRPEDALVVYATWANAPDSGKVELLSAAGERLRHWVLSADSVEKVTAAPLQDGYLVVWSSAGALQSTLLDPEMAGGMIAGEPLLGPDWKAGKPALVAGPNRTLCVFPGRAPGGQDHGMHAVLFDSAGAPVDSLPIDLHAERCEHCEPTGVWDSNCFFIVWDRWTEEDGRTSWATRVAQDGTLVDATPFQLPIGSWGLAVSADSIGNVYLGYGNHIRIIDDTNPFLEEDPIVFPGEDDWPRELRIGRILPNPSGGNVYLEVQIPAGSDARVTIHDSAGRLVHETPVGGPLSGLVRVWDGSVRDGRRAPAGAYYVQIDAGGTTTSRRTVILR